MQFAEGNNSLEKVSGPFTSPGSLISNESHNNAAVVIIGGGISGICMAIELLTRQKVNNFIIVEKSGGFGGTWRDNKFPGCCCDVWSHLYCFSFEQNPNWTRSYPGQKEILDYLVDVAQKYGLYKYVRFNSVVEEAIWNEETNNWKIAVSVTGGKDAEFGDKYFITSDFLVSGTGQLNVPRGIQVPGYKDYRGKIMHSARWDWSYNLVGKRVAIIGTGATTAQIVPEVAKNAAKLTVCQRTPAWVIPRHDKTVPEWQRQILKWCPPIRSRYRAEAMDLRESFFLAVTQKESIHAEKMREANGALLLAQLPDRPDLREKLAPKYSPGCKRSVISDDYYPSLARENVELETNSIERFTERGIKFVDKEEQQYDLIILATGFKSLDFLSTVNIVGRHGRSLKEIWSQTPFAHKGVMVPELPNFGILYGPNTNLTHNSLILMIEAQVRYLNAIISKVLKTQKQGQAMAVEPRKDVTDIYNRRIQQALQKTSFADPACNSWWKREDGVILNNWIGTAVDYQNMMSKVDWDEYTVDGSGDEALGRHVKPAGLRVLKIGRVIEETRLSRLGFFVLAASIFGVSIAIVLGRQFSL